MPPSIGSRCTLVVDGTRYDARVTDVEVTQERDAVHGSRGPIGFTSGQTIETVTLTLMGGPVRDAAQTTCSHPGCRSFATGSRYPTGEAVCPSHAPRGARQTGPIGATGATGAAPPSPTWSDIEVSVGGQVLTGTVINDVEFIEPELETDEELRARLVRHAPFAIGQVGYYHSPQSFGVAAGRDLDLIADSYGLERQLREPPAARAPTKDITQVPLTVNVTEPPKTRYELIREASL